MILLILAVNVVFWRPLTAWSERYKPESADRQRSFVLDLLRRSHWPHHLGRLRRLVAEPLGRAMRFLGRDGVRLPPPTPVRSRGDVVFNLVLVCAIAFGTY